LSCKNSVLSLYRRRFSLHYFRISRGCLGPTRVLACSCSRPDASYASSSGSACGARLFSVTCLALSPLNQGRHPHPSHLRFQPPYMQALSRSGLLESRLRRENDPSDRLNPYLLGDCFVERFHNIQSLNAPVSIHSFFSSDHQSTANPFKIYS